MGRLEEYVVKGGKRLRLGYTTGTCAAGAAGAAAAMLLERRRVPVIAVDTPSGRTVELDVEEIHLEVDRVRCGVRKDAGDDPDITDGALVLADVTRVAQGILVEGGAGVGRVTKPGLACPVGQAAINPVPMAMIRRALEEARARSGYAGGLRAVISVENGEVLAGRTFNPRLGIEGGLSILGTSGIVNPMSAQALVDTIEAEIKSRRARGEDILLLTPGNYGRDFARHALSADPDRAVKCSNFVGEALDLAVYHGFRRIILLGHAGKLVKLAGGILNTHSAVADGRMEILCAHAALAGADSAQAERLMDCVTVDAAHGLLREWGLDGAVWRTVAQRAHSHLARRAGAGVRVTLASFCGAGVVLEWPDFREELEAWRRMQEIDREWGKSLKGTLYGVGVGPGDPELLTIKAAKTIARCGVVAVPSSGTGSHMALDIARDSLEGQRILYCDLPMTRNAAALERCRRLAAEQLCAELEKGEDVAFLTIGDPGVYATYSYIHRLVAEEGYKTQIIPGITSFCAAAAALGRTLCEDDAPLHILPASMEGLEEALDCGGTKVLMKMGKSMDGVLALLERKGKLGRTALVERCTLPEQLVADPVDRDMDRPGYFTVLVVEEEG